MSADKQVPFYHHDLHCERSEQWAFIQIRPALCVWHSKALILHLRVCSEGMEEVLYYIRHFGPSFSL